MKEPKIKPDKVRKSKKTEIVDHLQKKVINNSLVRRIVFYPNLRVWKMHIANCATQLCYRSELTNEIIKKHYDSLPKDEQEKLLRYFDSMSPEEISHTRNIDNLK